MTELKAYHGIELLVEFKGLLLGMGLGLGFAGIRMLIENLTGI